MNGWDLFTIIQKFQKVVLSNKNSDYNKSEPTLIKSDDFQSNQ